MCAPGQPRENSWDLSVDATIRDPYLRAELQRAIAEGADRAREWWSSFDAVAAALSSWSERQLDRVRLPHPGMGLLTTREMVLFTLFHNQHHEAGVARRLSERG